MRRLVVLLRGVNLAGANRVSMPVLRSALDDAGFDDVATYVQSGNVVLSTSSSPKQVKDEIERIVVERFGLDIAVVVRTRDEIAAVVERNPLVRVATIPKLSLVTFLDADPDPAAVDTLGAAASDGEELVLVGRELYSWHPDGAGRSKLARLLSGKALGVTATSRNWSTVTALLALADERSSASRA
jgi:uncharacterized protein (DUF1697 family)